MPDSPFFEILEDLEKRRKRNRNIQLLKMITEIIEESMTDEEPSENQRVEDTTLPRMGVNRPNNIVDPRSIVPRAS